MGNYTPREKAIPVSQITWAVKAICVRGSHIVLLLFSVFFSHYFAQRLPLGMWKWPTADKFWGKPLFQVRGIGTGKRGSWELESIGKSWREEGWKRKPPNSVYVHWKFPAHLERHMYRRDLRKLSRSFENWTRISAMTYVWGWCMAMLTS